MSCQKFCHKDIHVQTLGEVMFERHLNEGYIEVIPKMIKWMAEAVEAGREPSKEEIMYQAEKIMSIARNAIGEMRRELHGMGEQWQTKT